ncbi:hypothetical protein BSKO_11532 [Bryopsis sp. KO-2023]|nr:hypothetical protein BSKO_11532 [Bryopsis sp. KO-2023]
MEGVWDLLTTCWSSLHLPFLSTLPAQDIFFSNRKFRVIQQLGEGGYSFVYLVKELPTVDALHVHCQRYALKKMLVSTGEQLINAQQEIDVLRQSRHPHIIPLLEASIVPEGFGEGEIHTVYMLFPWFREGTAVDVVSRLCNAHSRLSPFNVLDIFRQVCEGVAALHKTGYTHRDIKPHNILLEKRIQGEEGEGTHVSNSASVAMLSTIPEVSDEELDPDDCQNAVSYNAVLTDFGSVGPAEVSISTRQQALILQEEAQALCSMPYRAPELYDVPSSCVIDEKIDVWSLGCTLYFLMYGVSPFEGVLNEAGGSLALAVMNGRVTWPKPPTEHYPEELHSLVVYCLDTNLETRPGLQDLIDRVKDALKGGLPAS